MGIWTVNCHGLSRPAHAPYEYLVIYFLKKKVRKTQTCTPRQRGDTATSTQPVGTQEEPESPCTVQNRRTRVHARYNTEILQWVKSKTPGSFGFGTESTFSITKINCLDIVISASRLWSAIHNNINCLILIGQGCARLITRQQSHAVN